MSIGGTGLYDNDEKDFQNNLMQNAKQDLTIYLQNLYKKLSTYLI